MKNAAYIASVKRNPGRKGFVISFRHPLKTDNGKPGKKVFRGLGTDNPEEAKEWEAKMNALLAREDLHSVGSRAAAEREFDPLIVDIFYGDLDPSTTGHRAVRERLLPLPKPSTAVRTLFLGNSGVGKTTLLRRFIGCDKEQETFPATSANRTTTCEIEIITGQETYSAVVTFLTRHQTQQEITEALSNAVLKAIEGADDETVMKDLLDDPDQKFRLKYALGVWISPKAKASASMSFGANVKRKGGTTAENPEVLKNAVSAIRVIAADARSEVEPILGKLQDLKDEDRNYALDEMQRAGEGSEAFENLVGDLMEEIEDRFRECSECSDGKFSKSPTGWPEAWTFSAKADARDLFLKALERFCSNSKELWGHLLTPVVTGIRVAGPFRPDWVPDCEDFSFVFVDTQGLDHEKPATELSNATTSLFKEVHNILFVESGKDSLKSQSARKVMEAIAGTGYTAKLTVAMTHMDLVVGDDIPTEADRAAKAFSGLRSLVENEVSRNVSRDSARQLAAHLEASTFYLGYLDSKKYPENWEMDDKAAFNQALGEDLWRISQHLNQRANPALLQPSTPEYSFESLALAVREVSLAFQEIWDARLGYKRVEGISSARWQSIKAMSRRYAEGWFDGYWLRPIDTLVTLTRNVLTRFLEKPLKWNPEKKKISAEQQIAIIDRLKQIVNEELTELSEARLWKQPQTRWQSAYEPSGTGSTYLRKQLVHELLALQVPIPQSISDRWAQAWVEEIKQVLIRAVSKLQQEAEAPRSV